MVEKKVPKSFTFSYRPSSKQSLLKIDGIAEARAEKFGARLIEAICEFCKENSLKMDNFPATVPSHIADNKVRFI